MTGLVWIDAAYDRDNASDGISRYGRYLRDRRGEFDEDVLSDPVSFASLAWAIATGPIMAPGYVRWSDDITAIRCQRDDNGELVVDVEVRLRRALLAAGSRPDFRWRDWVREHGRLVEPAGAPAVLLTAHVLLPFSAQALYEPYSSTDARELKERDARGAVDLLADLINGHASDAVAALRGEPQ